MVIELSGVQFCLKSHTRFQNRMSKLLEFDLKSQVWFQNKIIRHKVQLPLYYSQIGITEFSQYRFIDQVANLLKRENMKRLYNSGMKRLEKKWWDLKQEWWDLEPTSDVILEQMWFRAKSRCISWINHTAETQSNCRDHQWFQDGYNKGNCYYLVLGSTAWWFRHTVKSICGNKNLVSRAYHQAPVFVKVDSTIPWVNHFPPDNTNGFLKIYPVDSPIQCLNNCSLGPFFF